MLIIGITGTLGAGKGTIVEYLCGQKGFVHFSVRAFLTEEIVRRGLEVNRDSMVAVANELRAQHGPAYIAEQLYEQALASGKNCIIESIRTPGEVELLKSKGNFILFAVDAPAEERYRRIIERASETDHISYQTFLDNEMREMNSDDPNKQNIARCIEQADVLVVNDGSVEHLHSKIEAILQNMKVI
jgi:dephospho-CoA kinase